MMSHLLKMMALLCFLIGGGVMGPSIPAFAVQPNEVLADPALESRAREISKDVRCLVCQNQSIDDSDADLARDLRLLVRARLLAGDSNQDVRDFLVARYGPYVLLTPPVRTSTVLLWGAPALLLGGGVVGVFFWYRGRRPGTQVSADSDQTLAAEPPALSAQERQKIAHLLDDQKGNNG